MEWYWYILIEWMTGVGMAIAFFRFLHKCDEDMHEQIENQKKGDAQ